MGSANSSLVRYKRREYFLTYLRSNYLSTLSPVTFTPSLITKCSEKLWSVWPLSAFQPSMPIQYSKNVMELMVMIMAMPLQLHLLVMMSQLPHMAHQLPHMMHQLHHTVNLLPLMENQLPHTENPLQPMELKKQLYQTSLQSSLVSLHLSVCHSCSHNL